LGKINWTLQTFRLDELTDYYKNPRSLSEKEFKQLKTSLDKFGMIDKPIVNLDAGNTIIGGHQRKHVLEASGVKECECWIPDRELTEREVEELNIRLNKNTGSFDFDILANEFELDDLLDWGFDKQELDLDLWAGDAPEDVEPQIDKAEELREKWQVQTGQLWQLGAHRLICGDCTDKAVVEKVMGGDRADCILTDPPYGMNLNTDYSDMPETRIASKTYDKVKGDDIDFDASSLIAMFDYVKEQFIWGGDYFYTTLPIGGSWIVWDKRNENSDGLVGNHFEVCWSRSPHRRRMIRVHWSGVNARNQGMKRSHPTEKSIEVLSQILGDYTEPKSIVVDVYSGVGTTIIACERLGRKCRAVEISPAYVAVAIQRWVDVTGGEPVLLESM